MTTIVGIVATLKGITDAKTAQKLLGNCANCILVVQFGCECVDCYIHKLLIL